MTCDLILVNSEGVPFPRSGIKIVNCTAHDISIRGESDEVILTIEPSGRAARCEMKVDHLGDFHRVSGDGYSLSEACIPLFGVGQTNGSVTRDLPVPKEGVMYIVSKIVAMANPHREDLLMIWDTVRDDSGKVLGCRGLSLPSAVGS